MNISKTKTGPTTIKGAWNQARRVAGAGTPSLKAYAREFISISLPTNEIHIDAKRWLSVKRPGGSDEQRQERKERRKERQAINAAAKAAKRGKGKTNLKPSGEGKKKG